MSKDMKLIMENWRQFENKSEKSLLMEKTVAQAIAKLKKAEKEFKAAESEEARKRFLISAFTGVTKFAIVVSLIPVLAKAAAAMGLTGAMFSIPALVKTFMGSGSAGEFITAYYDAIPKKFKDQFPDVMGMIKNKIASLTSDMVEKVLDMPDTESAKMDILDAIDVPDKLKDFLQPDALDAILKRLKTMITRIATDHNTTKLPADTLVYATRLISKIGGVKGLQDRRAPANSTISLD